MPISAIFISLEYSLVCAASNKVDYVEEYVEQGEAERPVAVQQSDWMCYCQQVYEHQHRVYSMHENIHRIHFVHFTCKTNTMDQSSRKEYKRSRKEQI